jgi:hypothetical protein
MTIRIDKSFEKDTDKIHDSKLLQRLALCIEQVMSCNTISEIKS